jgi:RNA polymerase sigma-70 factor, ECF subfamily
MALSKSESSSGSEQTPAADALLEHTFRRDAGRMVSHFARLVGPAHLQIAEDAVQDAMLRALQTWPYSGVPANPSGWLFRVARNAVIDALRQRRLHGEKAAEFVREAGTLAGEPVIDDSFQDDELRMVVLCCHPALSREASVALSLKLVGGFGVREIARAFLVDEAAIAQRLVRAKRQIRDQELTLELPDEGELRLRLSAVLEVLYFLFNEGYAAHEGEDLIRAEFCGEALRLARLVAASPVATPQVDALVALMAFQAARLRARVDDKGDLVLFEFQDRSRWDDRLIALGFRHFERSMAGDEITEYHAQAAIAATYARAADPQSIDWAAILLLYDQLLSINPSPVIALNRAVAVAKVHGAAEALRTIELLDDHPKLKEYHLLLAVRGHLLRELGRWTEAAQSYREALRLECSQPERRFLCGRLEECEQVLAKDI